LEKARKKGIRKRRGEKIPGGRSAETGLLLGGGKIWVGALKICPKEKRPLGSTKGLYKPPRSRDFRTCDKENPKGRRNSVQIFIPDTRELEPTQEMFFRGGTVGENSSFGKDQGTVSSCTGRKRVR